ncbi:MULTISPECIES: sensor histidine kinase [Actinomadura]|uniref:histidine kinase n=1 Tax=Actinomadura yumaensis TaxID=111807 RepID=A0ABW2CVZ1_9ACTN|nr:histidine kinase [Actinomadura sp. J1-007]
MSVTRTRWRPGGRWAAGRGGDVALAAGAALVTLVMSALAAKPHDTPLWPGGAALILVATLPLAVRRRHPVVVLAISGVVSPLYYPMGFPDGPVAFVFLVALFTAAVECRMIVSLLAVIGVDAAFVVVRVVRGGTTDDPAAIDDSGTVASLSAFLLITVAAGQYVRSRRDRVEAAERRAAQAERGREEEARRRATEERLRIARELHDVLAHQISLINVQAGAALHRRDDPAQAYASLEAIKHASKETLRELRGVLGVLRQVDEDDGGAAPPVSPAPSLSRLDELLEQTSAAGLTVLRAGDLAAHTPAPSPAPAPAPASAGVASAGAADPEADERPEAMPVPPPAAAAVHETTAHETTRETTRHGTTARGTSAYGTDRGAGHAGVPVPLPAPVDLAGYRIVQEALTNVVRHAGAVTATVDIRRTADAVIVQIDDDGAGPADPGALERGNGLRGMRERAAAVGGEMTAGAGPSGGFRVWARLPLEGPAGRTEEIA